MSEQERTSPERPGPPPPDAPPAAGRPTRRRGRGVALTLLVVVLLVATAAIAAVWSLSPAGVDPQPRTFEVQPGWGGVQVAEALGEAGLIRSAVAFEAYLRVRGLDRSIGEGLYDLAPSLSAPQVAAALVAGGRPRTARLVVPEGWRARDVAARIAANGFGSEAEVAERIARPGELAPPYLPDGAGLEGYLFPASYDVPVRATVDDALTVMVQRFEEEIDGDVAEALLARELTVHEWVTLASMVQAEAASHDEMGIIAGVFVNRLDLGMPLQSDPTVAYGLGKALPELDAVAGDLRQDTPYNTYTRADLPPGPIGNPGTHALRAVLEPVRIDANGEPYLYFLHGTDGGTPVFRPNTDLADHNRDVQRYLRNDGRP
ncbi:MAG: endolytic transglycosylase MltG [Trueperaceae bacterium]